MVKSPTAVRAKSAARNSETTQVRRIIDKDGEEQHQRLGWSYIGYQFVSVSRTNCAAWCMELCMDTLQKWSCQCHIYQADHICDQLNEATSTFHADGLPSDPDRSQLLLHWPGMNYQLTSATSRQLWLSRDTSRHYCLMLRIRLHDKRSAEAPDHAENCFKGSFKVIMILYRMAWELIRQIHDTVATK